MTFVKHIFIIFVLFIFFTVIYWGGMAYLSDWFFTQSETIDDPKIEVKPLLIWLLGLMFILIFYPLILRKQLQKTSKIDNLIITKSTDKTLWDFVEKFIYVISAILINCFIISFTPNLYFKMTGRFYRWEYASGIYSIIVTFVILFLPLILGLILGLSFYKDRNIKKHLLNFTLFFLFMLLFIAYSAVYAGYPFFLDFEKIILLINAI